MRQNPIDKTLKFIKLNTDNMTHNSLFSPLLKLIYLK